MKTTNLKSTIEKLKKDRNNAISHIYNDASFGQGSLKGCTVTVKDSFATKDAKTMCSSKILEDFEPKYDATVVKKLKESGAAVVAKTHLDELAMGGTGTYSAFGIIANPLNNEYMVGGSSSGAAATINHVSFAIGSDTGDSVRLPASYVGKVGFKPSYGAVSRYGLFAFAPSFDSPGWITHSVGDSIDASQVLFGQDDKDMTSMEVEKPEHELIKPKKVAVMKNEHQVLSPQMERDFKELKLKLKADGVEVNEVQVDIKLLNAVETVYSIVAYAELSSTDSNLNGIAFGKRESGKDWKEIMLKTRSKNFGSLAQRRFAIGTYFLSEEHFEDIFVRAQKVRRLIRDAFKEILDNHDILIFPSSKIPPKLNEKKDAVWFSSYLTHANISGTPSITIPFGQENDMPYGLSIDAGIYKDRKLLSHSLYLEKLIGGKNE